MKKIIIGFGHKSTLHILLYFTCILVIFTVNDTLTTNSMVWYDIAYLYLHTIYGSFLQCKILAML